ncbi:hypothetical protein LY78DRAFT_662093 [Colletotrichum sublineola]|nr:hypothetical protein LY78DRAFT_662093 [Colletotrichum sublineola]
MMTILPNGTVSTPPTGRSRISQTRNPKPHFPLLLFFESLMLPDRPKAWAPREPATHTDTNAETHKHAPPCTDLSCTPPASRASSPFRHAARPTIIRYSHTVTCSAENLEPQAINLQEVYRSSAEGKARVFLRLSQIVPIYPLVVAPDPSPPLHTQ